ncbi:hypothetical protein [Wenjunlia tyrosinilytica]|uniref:Uncharacterized protein n=1 Tax=Wenjunlia tyrosinilytica TaxID=1544741 RepID=A0A918DUQ9_9ACTN|nr:hypothetical protein [Wenjunlia tyrosinilytica]GGO82799.1 hypothetical protein GCM10012280_10290 [Wenjunlia tyrosinilytica]
MALMITGVVLAVAGLAVLAVLALRVSRELGRLTQELRRASHGIRAASEEVERVAAPLAARGGGARS